MCFSELHIAFFGTDRNKTGLVTLIIHGILIITGLFLPLFAIITGTDPIYMLRCHFCPNLAAESPVMYKLQLVLKWVWYQWLTLEATRALSVMNVSLIVLCKIYLVCLKSVQEGVIHEQTFHTYRQLHCLTQIGMCPTRQLSGHIMTAGLPMLVFINWVVLKGWPQIPMLLNCLFVVVGLMLYMVLDQTLPLAARCNEWSCNMLQAWKCLLSTRKNNLMYWTRVLKAQRPVSLSYGVTIFEKETKINYYSCIRDYTINALLMS